MAARYDEGRVMQCWRSFEQLEAFASDKDDPHLDVWHQYWRRVGRSGRSGMGALSV